MKPHSIAKTARDAKVGVETIRFYERRGLIAQPPRPAGKAARSYPPETVARVRFIREAQELGFSLKDIEELLELQVDPAADCADVRARALDRLDDVRRKIAQLRLIEAALDAVIAACPGQGALTSCSIIGQITNPPIATAIPPQQVSHHRRPAMKTVDFTIEGMRCKGCADTVTSLIEREAGVKAVQVAHQPATARVLFDPGKIEEDQLVAVIERPGYRVTGRR
jgi:DNA-binding transcriptional MerR regulator/copper chaperone CopZ